MGLHLEEVCCGAGPSGRVRGRLLHRELRARHDGEQLLDNDVADELRLGALEERHAREAALHQRLERRPVDRVGRGQAEDVLEWQHHVDDEFAGERHRAAHQLRLLGRDALGIQP